MFSINQKLLTLQVHVTLNNQNPLYAKVIERAHKPQLSDLAVIEHDS